MQIGVIVNPRKDNTSEILKSFDNWAVKYKTDIKFLLCTFNSPYIIKKPKNLKEVKEQYLLKHSDLIITLGGDGTLLRTVTKFDNTDQKKLLGVNLGGLGFLADTPPEKLIDHTEGFIKGNYFLDERTLLYCKVDGIKGFNALNDVVIDKAGFSRVIQIDVKIDGKHLNSYIADGVIISTPTGSTGYSLSAGGPILVPQTSVFLLNPICPHSLTNRPMVIDDDSEVLIQVWTEHDSFNLLSDGENQGKYSSGTKFLVKKSPVKVGLVKVKSQNFFKTLNKKLRWGEDFRNKKRWTYQKENKN